MNDSDPVFIEVYVDDESDDTTYTIQLNDTLQLRVSQAIDDDILVRLVDVLCAC